MIIVMTPISDLLTDKEKCFIAAAKRLLGDYDPQCVIYQDMALLCFMQFAIDDINAHPTPTFFTLECWPRNWESLILQGMQINALAAQALYEQGKEFEINDNGVVLSPPPVTANLRELHGSILANYEERKERVKANFKPSAVALGSTRIFGYGVTRILEDRHKRYGRIF